MAQRILSGILFAFILIAALPAMAEKAQVGTVVEVEGKVFAALEGKTRSIKTDAPVFLNDKLTTGPGGRLLLLMVDDTEITLGENAELAIDEYVFYPEERYAYENKARFSVLRGSFLFVSGLISKKATPDVKVETSYGSIGIRGTTFWGGEIDGEYGVLVQDGEVTVENERGRVRIRPGYGTMLRNRTSMPDLPRQWGTGKIERATQTVFLRNHAQMEERIARHKEKNKELREKRTERLKEHRKERMEKMQDKRTERPVRKKLEEHRKEKAGDRTNQRPRPPRD